MIINPYASLEDFKSHTTPRGQTVVVDVLDDRLVSDILDEAARQVDSECHRTFYPRYETRWFDVPVYQNSPRTLFLDDDLLEAVKVTNGDTNEVLPAVYNLKPKNYSPHYAIQIIGPTSIFWIFNGIGNIEKVISVEGWWGFHNRYGQRAWTVCGTLAAAITTTTSLSFTLSAGHTLKADSIVKIDAEIMNISATNLGGATAIQRGDNGSTAATHLISVPVYVWNVQPEIRLNTLQRAEKIYQERLGVTYGGNNAAKTKYEVNDITGFIKVIS
ncbi:conserved hypothetical protein [Gammaproteobacteria bacterium]